MKIFNLFSAAVLTALVVCGCSENPLAYVEKSADKVEFGNTEVLLTEKGKKAEKHGFLESSFFGELKNLLGEDKALKLNITYARWSEIGKNQTPELVGAVIVVNDGDAQDLFSDLRKAYRRDDKWTVKKKEVGEDNTDAFIVYKDAACKKIEVSYILASDKSIHVVYGDDPAVFDKNNESELAGKIDSSAVFAAIKKSEDKEKGTIIGKNEMFFSDDEIKVSLTTDISELKDIKDK